LGQNLQNKWLSGGNYPLKTSSALAEELMVLLDGVHSQTANSAMEICRILLRDRDFNESKAACLQWNQELSQLSRVNLQYDSTVSQPLSDTAS
jgi:hypothetical protein